MDSLLKLMEFNHVFLYICENAIIIGGTLPIKLISVKHCKVGSRNYAVQYVVQSIGGCNSILCNSILGAFTLCRHLE